MGNFSTHNKINNENNSLSILRSYGNNSKYFNVPRQLLYNSLDIQPKQLSFPIKQPTDVTRFVILSDTHSRVHEIESEIPSGDVLIHAGDFTNEGKKEEIDQFVDFLQRMKHKYKIVIRGNHEISFDLERHKKLKKNNQQEIDTENLLQQFIQSDCCIYLQDEEINIGGIRIWGAPWCSESEKLIQKYSAIPQNIDILVTHSPPFGYNDGESMHSGCVILLEHVERVKPKFHVYGHVHEGYGIKTNGTTIFINGSTCTQNLLPINPPIVFDIPNP